MPWRLALLASVGGPSRSAAAAVWTVVEESIVLVVPSTVHPVLDVLLPRTSASKGSAPLCQPPMSLCLEIGRYG